MTFRVARGLSPGPRLGVLELKLSWSLILCSRECREHQAHGLARGPLFPRVQGSAESRQSPTRTRGVLALRAPPREVQTWILSREVLLHVGLLPRRICRRRMNRRRSSVLRGALETHLS